MYKKDELQRQIMEAVTRSWEADSKVLLLSALGDLKDGGIARSAREYAGSLKSFIDTEIPEVRILEHSQIRSLIGVVPNHVSEAADSILDKSRSETIRKVYFKEHFWNAFKNPLDSEKRRFVVSHTNVNSPDVVDIPSADQTPSNSHEVSRSLIERNISSDEIYDRIIKWIKDTGSLMEDYTKTTRMISEGGSRTLLLRLLESLDECDAKRISIPLDIAQKLSRIRL